MHRWTTSEGIVTPEAVRLQFEEAGVGSRGVALLIDLAVEFAVLFVLAVATGFLAEAGGFGFPAWVGAALFLVLYLTVFLGYPIAFETLTRGQTLGKMVMGLRVVTTEGAPVRFRHAAVRAALGLVDFAMTLGSAAVVAALLSSRSQRLGDMAAGTIVLRERTGAPAPTAVRFEVPHGAEGYASTIDASTLRPQDYAAVRVFLLRAPALPPARRAAIGADLARAVTQRFGHAPPAGLSPEVVLTCVAARYQQRGGVGARSPSEHGAVAVARQPPVDDRGRPAAPPSDAGFASPP